MEKGGNISFDQEIYFTLKSIIFGKVFEPMTKPKKWIEFSITQSHQQHPSLGMPTFFNTFS